MACIQDIELNHPDGPVHKSDAYPWMDEAKYHQTLFRRKQTYGFLPCHYFDYVAGT